MAVDTEAKRWSMLAFSPMRTHVFNPDTSGLVSIEKITILQHYGGIAWASPAGGVSIPIAAYHYNHHLGSMSS